MDLLKILSSHEKDEAFLGDIKGFFLRPHRVSRALAIKTLVLMGDSKINPRVYQRIYPLEDGYVRKLF